MTATALASWVLVPLGFAPANAAPVGAGFELNRADLDFILKQIDISERHALTRTPQEPCSTLLGMGENQIPNNGPNGEVLPWGVRTVDGSCNNLVPGQETFGAADETFPRIVPAEYQTGEDFDPDGTGPAPGSPTDYGAPNTFVVDSRPRLISNLVVDQTKGNPAAVAASGLTAAEVEQAAADDTMPIPNVAPDVGLSAPFNSMFTLFGQFFDHGLDLVGKTGGTVYMPLRADDPLNERVTNPNMRFMLLSRATLDENGESVNLTTPYVDQNQTYTSHPSHQVFLREYETSPLDHDNDPNTPDINTAVPSGRLIESDEGMATWTRVQEQARDLLGIELSDKDVLNVPLLATDPYGHFIPGPNGLPQLVTTDDQLVEGNLTTPVSPAAVGARPTGHAFLDDIAHHAVPVADLDGQGPGGPVDLAPDGDTDVVDDGDPTTYDDEMLGAHFIAGDGRANENIGLTSVHHIFHSEHNRLTGAIETLINEQDQAFIDRWHRIGTQAGSWNYGERLFQAARFVTEMEYQHLVFEEFARKVQPMVNVFGEGGTGYETTTDAAISAEFAHAVYRFGHSMLTETVARRNVVAGAPVNNDIGLIEAFLNPQAFRDGGGGVTLTPDEAAGSVFRGMSRQVGNEIDEFVTEALRNNLLGLPLDLATINMARARDTGIPTLNRARAAFYAESNNTAVAPYENWVDFGFNLKHEESLLNFVAAYATHPSVRDSGPDGVMGNEDDVLSVAAKRAAAAELINPTPVQAVIEPGATEPTPEAIAQAEADTAAKLAEAEAFMNATGAWATEETGINHVDLWVGGLAEKQMVFGGLLGSTFNFVFEKEMEDLQFADRFYYLSRTQGMNLLVQLEGNSFAELVMRNTDVEGLPADVFSRPDLIFNLANMGPVRGPIEDDPTTENDESTQENLTWMANGTLRFNGPEHAVFNGRDDAATGDRMWASEGDDTMRGNAGNDWMQGGDGADNLVGGEGNDILNDLFGDDVIKGGPGNDAISSGQGFAGDLNMGGFGKDFIVGGNDTTESFAGNGDDFVFAGEGEDTVFGDEGDDWIEGGKGPFNLLQGDSGNPFQDDPHGGHDVIDGDGGEQDFDAEGGDDIMLAGPGIQRSEGMLGFDWVTHKGDPDPADSDMDITVLLPPTIDNLKDRFDLVEALSGWDKDDVLRGDSRVAADLNGVDHSLNADGIARIAGLADILPVGATSFDGGNIILGGAGSDTIEGRGGDDIIDGDRWLDVRLGIDTDDDGVPEPSPLYNSMRELQSSVFSGSLDPGDIYIVRSIHATPQNTAAQHGPDTAVFTGARADYTITEDAGTVTVTHNNAGIDGVDTLRNVELLQFTDRIVDLTTTAPDSPVIGTATAGNASATVTWTAPASDGGAPITEYRVQVHEGTTQVGELANIAATATSTQATNLTNGVEYTFTVTAVNERGESAPSASSNPVTPQPPALLPPGAPTGVTAVAGNAQATVSWTPPAANGGPAITEYRVQVLNGTTVVSTVTGIAPTATSRVVTGLTNGTAYSFAVLAVNADGVSAPSTASNVVTPQGDTTAPTVTNRVPGVGATGVNRGVNVVVTFSEAVTGVTATTMVLTAPNGATVRARVTLSANGLTATMNPNGSLNRNTAYTVTLTGGTNAIRDLSGNPLTTVTWTFTTGR